MNERPTIPTYKPNGWLLGTPVKRITPKSEWLEKLERKQAGILDASSNPDSAGYKPHSLFDDVELFP